MKIPRNLNGNELVHVLCTSWKYTRIHQTGSHIILETEEPAHQRIAVPAHKPLRIGTLNSILRAIALHKGIKKENIIDSL